MEKNSYSEEKETDKFDSTAKQDELGKTENDLAGQLKKLCNKNKKEIEPQLSGQLLYQLGRIYLERSEIHDDNDRKRMISLIRSACLFNAAITRKPENLQVVQKDLKSLCRKVLERAGARDTNADLISQSNIVKQKILIMRNKVQQQLHEIDSNQNKSTNKLEKENFKIIAIKKLQNDITTRYTNIMAELLHYCQTVMGDPPCKFSLVGMGSLARKEITPYSDFEHIIVLEQNSEQRSDYKDVLNYFRWLSVIFQIVLINLQETILPCVNIGSLEGFYDGFTTHGICFDSMMPHACKFPLGRTETTENNQSTTELIKSVDEMLKYLTADEDLKNGYHLKDILTKVCYVGGDKSVFDQFQTKVYESLKQENHDEKVNSIKNLLMEDLDNFATRSKLLDLSSTSFNIKKDFYRSSTIFISALGQLHNIEASSCFDISEALETIGVINNKVKHYQMYAVALACELRLKWYMKQQRQEDFIRSTTDDQDFIQTLLNTVDKSSVIKYFQITYAVQCDISKQFGLQKIHFYTDPKLLNCKLYYRFKKDRNFNQFVSDYALTECNKTERLYLTEEILNQLEDGLEIRDQTENKQMVDTKHIKTNIEEKLLEYALWFETQESYDEAKELYQILFDMIENKQQRKTTNSDSEFSSEKQTNHQRTEIINKIGFCLNHMHKPGEAITYLQRSMTIYEKASLDLIQDVGFAETLHNIGKCLIDMHKPGEAITYLQRSMTIVEKASLDVSQDVTLATTLTNIGMCLMDMHKPGEAITYLQRSLAIHEKVSLDLGQDDSFCGTLSNIGLCLMNMNKPNEAITYLQRSRTMIEKASVGLSQDINFATILNNIGKCMIDMHKPGEAIAYLQRSVTIYQRASLNLSQDDNFATALSNIGKCLIDMHKPGEAITYLQRSLAIHKKASLDLGQDAFFPGTLTNIGNCLMKMHKPGEAITYFQRAMKMVEISSLDLSQDVNFASSLNNIGLCLMGMHKPGEAITYLQRSLEIDEKTSVDLSQDVSFATALNNIGNCLMDIHKPGEAVTYLQRSLEIHEKASFDVRKDISFATTLKNIGVCLIDMHKPGEAITYLKRCLAINQEVSLDLTQDTNFAQTLNNIGKCLMDMDKPAEAIIYLQRSMTIYEKASVDLSQDVNFSRTLNNIGLCLGRLNKSDEAITYLQRSLEIDEKASVDLSQDVSFAKTLNNIGACLMDMHKPSEALIYFRRSLTIHEKASVDLSQNVLSAETLCNIGMCLMDMGNFEEAWTYLQRSQKIQKIPLMVINDII